MFWRRKKKDPWESVVSHIDLSPEGAGRHLGRELANEREEDFAKAKTLVELAAGGDKEMWDRAQIMIRTAMRTAFEEAERAGDPARGLRVMERIARMVPERLQGEFTLEYFRKAGS